MEASAERVRLSRADRLLGLAINPYVIVVAMTGLAAAFAALRVVSVPPWLLVIGASAGWSSAWSP